MSAYESDERARRRHRHRMEAIIGAPLAKNKAEATLQMWNFLGRKYPKAGVAHYQDGVRVFPDTTGGPSCAEADTLYQALEHAVINLDPQCQEEKRSELVALLEKVQRAAQERHAELGYPLLRYWQAREEADRIAWRFTPTMHDELVGPARELQQNGLFGMSLRVRIWETSDLRAIIRQVLYGEALLWLGKSEDKVRAESVWSKP